MFGRKKEPMQPIIITQEETQEIADMLTEERGIRESIEHLAKRLGEVQQQRAEWWKKIIETYGLEGNLVLDTDTCTIRERK